MDSSWFHSDAFQWVILPLLIFCARVVDVSIGTIRIIFVSKGQKILAPLLGFFEVLIWLMAIGQVMNNLQNVLGYIAYAGGFATGNFVGMYIEEKLAMGYLVLRVITPRAAEQMVQKLTAAGYGVTRVEASGSQGQVTLIYSVIRRKDLQEVAGLIKSVDRKAFYSVEDARIAYEGIFPSRRAGRRSLLNLPRTRRKGK